MSAAAKVDLDHEEEDRNAILADEISMTPVYGQPDPHYRTCCGKVHVETASKYIAIVSLVFQLTAMLYSVMFIVASRTPLPSLWMLVLQITLYGIGIYSYVAILIALNKRIARYYWPFLMYNGLAVVTISIAGVAIVVLFIKYYDQFQDKQMVVMMAVFIASSFGQLLLHAWMEMVVYKAYKFMLYHHNGSHNRMMHYNNQI
ncbi:hypothetical protein DdX_19424 [Ditylenchus destructor]|uniref:Uncharacterized protein n=1 Tax=Ditylenchus destructor TaxID=166010 RepID=A0AAD4QU78_9BILA|nr:hypothetical protein DdX_19424 [Ditylenchus destructor]